MGIYMKKAASYGTQPFCLLMLWKIYLFLYISS